MQMYTLPELIQMGRDIILSIVGGYGLFLVERNRRWRFRWDVETKRKERLTQYENALRDKNANTRGAVQDLIQFLKEHKRLSEEEYRILSQRVLGDLCDYICETTGEKDYRLKNTYKPSKEIQWMLRQVFVQEYDLFLDCVADLQGCYLIGADLRNARLRRANLDHAILLMSNLGFADLREANLYHASLIRATLNYTEMQESILDHAQLYGVFLRGTQLQFARLNHALFCGATLREVEMQLSNLEETDFQGALFSHVQMQEARFAGTQLQGIGGPSDKSYPAGYDFWGQDSEYWPEFESRMNDRAYKTSGLDEIISAGGMQEKDLDRISGRISITNSMGLQELKHHVGKDESHGLPADCDADTSSYTKEYAGKLINRYNGAMGKRRRRLVSPGIQW